jgi:hypothetical protein
MSVVRSELKQATGEGLTPRPGVVAEPADPLDAALEEIAKVEVALRNTGDAATLERFGDAENGAALAELLGHARLSTEEARTVDQLSWMPDGMKLVRAYLRTVQLANREGRT